MARLISNGVYQLIMLFVVCAISAVLGFSLRDNKKVNTVTTHQPESVNQWDEKTIIRKEYPNEPFEVGNFSVKKVKFEPPQKFNVRTLSESGGGQAEDWLENLEFTIKNKSDKPITYINLDLVFPETALSGGVMVYQIDIGIYPTLVERLKSFST